MLQQELWQISGHWDNYKDNMFISEIEDKTFAIKPMNCPGGMLVFKNGLHSYRDLPLKVGELGHVHRYEASGALNGLFRELERYSRRCPYFYGKPIKKRDLKFTFFI